MSKKKNKILSADPKKKNIPFLYKITGAALIAAIILFIIFNYVMKNENKPEEYVFKKEGELVFLDSLNNSKIKIDIEIADNDYERQLGLMKRSKMGENQGMLFIFPVEEYQSFWMRNTFISLDIMFVNSAKKIVTIHKNTQTLSDQSYPSSRPAIYVVEVIAGFTDRHKIIEGDKIYWMDTRLNL